MGIYFIREIEQNILLIYSKHTEKSKIKHLLIEKQLEKEKNRKNEMRYSRN